MKEPRLNHYRVRYIIGDRKEVCIVFAENCKQVKELAKADKIINIRCIGRDPK